MLGAHNSILVSEEQSSFQNIIKPSVQNFQGFPGGSEVKNLPANAGDVGLIPGPGRFHMSWSNKAHVPQLLSHDATKPMYHNY